MNDEKMMKVLRRVISGIDAIFMCITVVLQMWTSEVLRNAILCSCVLCLTTVVLIFDGILQDRKYMAIHGFWYALYFLNMLVSLFKL